MILFLSNGKQIRGDLIIAATLRNDLAPIPVTLEADIRMDDDIGRFIAEGKTLSTAAGDALLIVKTIEVKDRTAQGGRERAAVRVTAILNACHAIAFVRERAIIKERASLGEIYRAAGAAIRTVDADFPVPRFCCLAGDTPSFHIARVIQEEGGAVRWKNGRLQFIRLPDLFRQKPAKTLPNNASDDVKSGFLERHSVPWFFSVGPDGAIVQGNRTKPRAVAFAPHQNVQRLRSMGRCLVHRKTQKIDFDASLAAGDLVNYVGGPPLAVITAVHVFETDAEGGNGAQYTRLWLGSLEE